MILNVNQKPREFLRQSNPSTLSKTKQGLKLTTGIQKIPSTSLWQWYILSMLARRNRKLRHLLWRRRRSTDTSGSLVVVKKQAWNSNNYKRDSVATDEAFRRRTKIFQSRQSATRTKLFDIACGYDALFRDIDYWLERNECRLQTICFMSIIKAGRENHSNLIIIDPEHLTAPSDLS